MARRRSRRAGSPVAARGGARRTAGRAVASIAGVSTPTEQQPEGTPEPVAADMVRACDRCGTVCAADQEWCLNCGVRMTEASQRLPGLRTAGLVVALAVLLAGGAAAASYAALRGDARSAANVPADTTAAPVAVAPTTTAAPVVPVTPAPTTTSSTTTTAKKSPSVPAPSAPSAGTGAATPDTGGATGSTGGGTGSTGGSTGGGTGSTGGGTGSADPDDDDTTTTEEEDPTPSGPIVFASGQGSIYDPGDVAATTGDQAKAIDGSTGSTWKVVLKEGQTSGLGYVLDFTPATALKSLRIASGTAGLRIKVLGTTQSTLPPDALDNGWETIASDRTLKEGPNSVPLKAVSGAKSKYRHVLVLFTTVPGTPATAEIREFTAVR